MLLSEEDIQRLENAGYSRDRFVRYDRHGYAMLRNRKGYCCFYDSERHRCKAYSYRPLGCRIYPVICGEEKAVFADELCPMSRTVSKKELQRKGKNVIKLLERIELEARSRTQPMRS
jgi:hypothetical protein